MLTNGEGFSFELCSSIRPSLKKLLQFFNIRVSDLIPLVNNICKLSRDMSSIAVVTVYKGASEGEGPCRNSHQGMIHRQSKPRLGS
jgi:hypothetical protein